MILTHYNKGYQMETYNQMLWVNFCSVAISSIWLLIDDSFSKVGSAVRCKLDPSSLTLA